MISLTEKISEDVYYIVEENSLISVKAPAWNKIIWAICLKVHRQGKDPIEDQIKDLSKGLK